MDERYGYNNVAVFEADDWFEHDSGQYLFEPKELSNAHDFCQLSCENHIRYLENGVAIVSNTFTRGKELLPYISIAIKYSCSLEIRETATPWAKDPEICAKFNTHGLTRAMIEKQLDRWQDIPVGIYSGESLQKLYNTLVSSGLGAL